MNIRTLGQKTPPRSASTSILHKNNRKKQSYSAGSSVAYQTKPDPPSQFDSSDLGSPKKVWSLLCEKDEEYKRDPLLFKRQREINGKMRSMLLDWLMDVSADKNLHRETFHLMVDYIDRYLGLMFEKRQKVIPQRLQLIGATALLIAAKIEEIYPPRVGEIADYTDGCCTTQDLRDMEELMLQQLDWKCYPVTAIHWLALYMQLMSTNDVIRAQQVIVTAPTRRQSLMPESPGTPRPPSLNVSIVLNEGSGGNANPSEENDGNIPVKREIDGGKQPKEDAENHKPANGVSAKKSSGKKRILSFNSSFPRVQLAHIGSSPKVLIHTAACDLSYVGHRTYSSGHIYPDQRCTVPKLMRGEFVRMAMIIDLVMLDIGSLRFRYRELAAGVLLSSYEPQSLICQITGIPIDQLRAVRDFVEPFVQLIDRIEPTGTQIPCFPDVPHDDRHNIQTYISNCLIHLESLENTRKEMEERRKLTSERVTTAVQQSRKRKFGSTLNAAIGLSHEV